MNDATFSVLAVPTLLVYLAWRIWGQPALDTWLASQRQPRRTPAPRQRLPPTAVPLQNNPDTAPQ